MSAPVPASSPVPGRALGWSEIRAAVAPRQRWLAALRPAVCALIALPFAIVFALHPFVLLLVPFLFGVLVFVAFLREALRNAAADPLVIRGRVIQRGGVWETDSGGPVDVGTTRLVYVSRVTIDVREACFVDRAGRRTPAPQHLGRCEIDQPWWVKRVALGEEVALVCLPQSGDPLLKLDVAALAAADRGRGAASPGDGAA